MAKVKSRKARQQLAAQTRVKEARLRVQEAAEWKERARHRAEQARHEEETSRYRLREAQLREEERLRAEARKNAPAHCDHCHERMPPWFLTPPMEASVDGGSGIFNDGVGVEAVYRYCYHCDRGFPYPEPGETQSDYEVRLDAWEPPKDPPPPAGGSDV